MARIACRRYRSKRGSAQRDRIFLAADRTGTGRRCSRRAGTRHLRRSEVGPRNRRTGHENRPRRPSLIVDLAHPVQKCDQVVYLTFTQVLLRHQAAMTLLVIERRRVAHVCFQVLLAAQLRDLREIRRVIRAFSEQSVTVHAVVFVPDVSTALHLRRVVLLVRQLIELRMAVHRQRKKRKDRNAR